ncbi:molybdopterin-guanine dinucleotide biosynthesis protein B [Gammaproteobacteria bacterium 42_54_T18]|nr:molybdopterin-guanine dinucleotide biosynthesis protein B [Gammaproteobacteria bacterium 42_54_T18]
MNSQFDYPLPVLGFVAYCSNTGKTTLLKQVISLLKNKGVRVGIVKHCHHEIQIDKPGKDSYELRKAGAEQAILASSNGWALMMENEVPAYPKLEYLLERMDTEMLDVVLLEGFRQGLVPKVEVSRAELNTPLLCESVDSPELARSVVALVTDADDLIERALKREQEGMSVLPLNHPQEVVVFIERWIERYHSYHESM